MRATWTGMIPRDEIYSPLLAIFQVVEFRHSTHRSTWLTGRRPEVSRLASHFCKSLSSYGWLALWNILYLSIYWECHHPNWLIFFRGVETTNQMVKNDKNCHGCFRMVACQHEPLSSLSVWNKSTNLQKPTPDHHLYIWEDWTDSCAIVCIHTTSFFHYIIHIYIYICIHIIYDPFGRLIP